MSSSPYSINGSVSLSVYIGEIEFPFTKASQLGFLHMSESSKLDIPMFHLQVTDGIEFFKQHPGLLVEGNLITFEVAARGVDSFSYDFRINATKTEPSSSGDVVSIDGYLDYPKYWIETTRRSYVNMSTSAVLKEIAKYVGLTYVGPDTNDSQNWYGSNSRYHSFCKEVANRGYLSENSCMKLAVDFDGDLLYTDIAEVGEPLETFTLATMEMGKVPIVSYVPKNIGGAANRRTGYRQTLGEQSAMRPTLSRTHDKIKVTVDEGGELNVNQDVKIAVRQGAHVIAPIDYGNVNENYHRARYQNNRGTSIYTFGLDIVTPVSTVGSGLTIFDTILVEAPKEQEELAGLYVIATKAIVIADGQYHEKFEIARRSVASTQSKTSVDSTKYEEADSDLYKDANV